MAWKQSPGNIYKRARNQILSQITTAIGKTVKEISWIETGQEKPDAGSHVADILWANHQQILLREMGRQHRSKTSLAVIEYQTEILEGMGGIYAHLAAAKSYGDTDVIWLQRNELEERKSTTLALLRETRAAVKQFNEQYSTANTGQKQSQGYEKDRKILRDASSLAVNAAMEALQVTMNADRSTGSKHGPLPKPLRRVDTGAMSFVGIVGDTLAFFRDKPEVA